MFKEGGLILTFFLLLEELDELLDEDFFLIPTATAGGFIFKEGGLISSFLFLLEELDELLEDFFLMPIWTAGGLILTEGALISIPGGFIAIFFFLDEELEDFFFIPTFTAGTLTSIPIFFFFPELLDELLDFFSLPPIRIFGSLTFHFPFLPLSELDPLILIPKPGVLT